MISCWQHELDLFSKKRNKRAQEIIEGKLSKHVVKYDNKQYWVSDNRLKREMPEVENGKKEVEQALVNCAWWIWSRL